MTSIYKEVNALGGYVDHHESDLYIEVNPVNREILSRYPCERANATTFINQVTGKLCYDVPFSFDPFWTAKKWTRCCKDEEVSQ